MPATAASTLAAAACEAEHEWRMALLIHVDCLGSRIAA